MYTIYLCEFASSSLTRPIEDTNIVDEMHMISDIVHVRGRSDHVIAQALPHVKSTPTRLWSGFYSIFKTQFRQAETSTRAQSTLCVSLNPVAVGSKPSNLTYIFSRYSDF
jgi:hypothetical protein